MANYRNILREALSLTQALSDKTRLRILMVLDGHELCVCQINEVIRLAPATVSKHLALLYQARLLETRKVGRWVYYRLEPGDESRLPRRALWRLMKSSLRRDGVIREDARRLEGILRLDPETLCRRQSRRRQEP